MKIDLLPSKQRVGDSSDSALAARPKFKTGAGREVYGGEGIYPDVVLKQGPALTQTQIDLLVKRVFFEFATRYVAAHKDLKWTPGSLGKDFQLTESDWAEVRRIAVPIMTQQAVFSGLNMLAVVFVGQKGDVAVAAVGLVGQIACLLNLVHFGIISAAAMFTAQFWGRRDVPNLRRVLGLCLILAPAASLIFFTLSQLFPQPQTVGARRVRRTGTGSAQGGRNPVDSRDG